MKRSLTLAAAAMIVAASTALSFAPAEAAPLVPSPVAKSNGDILQVQRWENFHGDRHSIFRDDNGWDRDRRWRGRHHHNRRHARHHRRNFYFGFPFALMPPYYSYHHQPHRRYYQDCFRTWDGQLICR